MATRNLTKNRQINIKVSDWQYRALVLMGGATAVLEKAIEKESGDKDKLLLMKRRIQANIEAERKQEQEIDTLIKEYSERKEDDKLKDSRLKSLNDLLKTNFKEWTSLNKKHAMEVGKFKDKVELEKWVKEHQ